MEEKKREKKYRRYGTLLYYFIKLLSLSFSFHRIASERIRETEETYIFCFWHEKLLVTALSMRHVEKKAALASPSKDGELISVPLERMGFEMIRGSSNQKSVSSVISLLKYLKRGYSLGTPVDGPKGPAHKVKTGLLYLAQKSAVKIIPVGGAYTRKWILRKSWDQFQIPKPFSKIIYALGDPISVTEDMNLEDLALRLEREINHLNDIAEQTAKEGKDETSK